MPFTEDLSAFLNVDEFATAATWNAGTIYGIFDNGYLGVPAGVVVDLESAATSYHCQTADVSTAVHGDTITINAVVYTIVGIQPDGTGMTTLILQAP